MKLSVLFIQRVCFSLIGDTHYLATVNHTEAVQMLHRATSYAARCDPSMSVAGTFKKSLIGVPWKVAFAMSGGAGGHSVVRSSGIEAMPLIEPTARDRPCPPSTNLSLCSLKSRFIASTALCLSRKMSGTSH